MWRETIKLRLAWSLLFILRGKFSATANHCAVEHDLQKYSRALRASLPLLYWKIMGPYPIKNCIKSRKYYMHFRGICVMKAFLPVQMLSAAPGLRLRTAARCHLPPFRCYTTHTHTHIHAHTETNTHLSFFRKAVKTDLGRNSEAGMWYVCWFTSHSIIFVQLQLHCNMSWKSLFPHLNISNII